MNKISDYLSSADQNYKTGLDLLNVLSAKNEKLKFLKTAENAQKGSLHHNLLLGEIKNAYRIHLNNGTLEDLLVTPQTITAKPLALKKDRFVYNEIVDVKQLPPQMQKLFFRNQELTRQLAGLHQELKAATSDTQRKTLAENIKTLHDERIENWKLLDDYSAGKSKPDDNNKTDNQNPNSDLLDKIARAEKEINSGTLSKNLITQRKRMITVWKKKLQKENKE